MKTNPLKLTGLRAILVVMLLAVAVCQVGAADKPAAPAPDLARLLLLGLTQNPGLKAYRIDQLRASEEVTVQDARFDLELYAAGTQAGSRSQVVEQGYAGLVDSRLSRAEVGLRKSFASGLSSNLALSSERGETDNSPLDPYYASSLQLDLRQPLLRNFGQAINLTDVQISQFQLQQSQSLFLDQARQLSLQIELAFYELVRARQTELLREQSRQLVLELLEANRIRLEAGVIPVTEVQEAETALAGRDLQLALAQKSRDLVVHQLDGLLNDRIAADLAWDEPEVKRLLTRPEPGAEFPALYQQALETRADLRQLTDQQQSLALRSRYLSNQARPNLDLVASLALSGLTGKDQSGSLPQLFDRRFLESYQGLAAGDGYQWTAGFSFSVPLGNRAAEARAEQARLAERQVDYRRRELERAIETELRQRLVELKRTAEQFAIAERFQALAEKSLEQEQRRLGEGLSDTFRVLDFQGDMIDARIERLSALIEYHKSRARLYQVLGANLERHGIHTRFENKEIRFEYM
ncbi:MAG: TolC family protein [Desulfuromonadales bacterium]|nr:TolC family protein [Desulfuromonadales bacterium]